MSKQERLKLLTRPLLSLLGCFSGPHEIAHSLMPAVRHPDRRQLTRWLWVRHQPHAVLTLWFRDRVKQNGGRLKKTTIVALARKLLVALWKYVNAGVVIEGAVMKTA